MLELQESFYSVAQALAFLVRLLSSCPTHHCASEVEISIIIGAVYMSLQFPKCLLPRFWWPVIGCVSTYNYYISCYIEPFSNIQYSPLSHTFFWIKASFV